MADNQRQIKFRAWDGDLREMHTVSAVFFEACLSPLGTKPYLIDGHNDLHDLDAVILMQFTGLHDSAGVPVFEGDICGYAADPSRFEVVFKDGAFRKAYSNWEDNTLSYPILEQWDLSNLSIFVLGNIHQHPHLLTEAK